MEKIMIIDNDPAILDIVGEIFTYEGFEVKMIGKADDIVGEVCADTPDVILLDYILDGVNGGELCARLKADPRTSTIPVIIMSAYPRVLQSLGTYGCDAFIAKPFDLDDLTGEVRRLTQTTRRAI